MLLNHQIINKKAVLGLATCQRKRMVPSNEPNALRQGSHPHAKQQTFRINLRWRGGANPCQLSGPFGHSGLSRIDRCDVGCGHAVPCRADTAVSQAVPNSRSHTRWTTLSDGESVLGGFVLCFCTDVCGPSQHIPQTKWKQIFELVSVPFQCITINYNLVNAMLQNITLHRKKLSLCLVIRGYAVE
jgi:hypothetical protein